MAKTAILNAADMTLAGVGSSKKQIAEIVGDKPDDFVLVTKATFQPTDEVATFEELCGAPKKEKKVKEDKPAKEPRAVPLEGKYTIVKPLPAVADDHPKKVIWDAIVANSTCEDAKAACPKENPKRFTNGTYSFSSEFRYFLKTGYIVLGDAPAEAPQEETTAEATE